jgi:hypothetical protein
MSTQPLTEVEQAAARAIGGDFECTWHVGCDEECNADRARAVVAAVRGPLLHEAADRMLQHATDAENHDATDSAVYTFMVAADRLRDWACHPLSRPTSEEH